MPPLLKVENLCKRYAKRSLAGLRQDVLAVDAVSFSISPRTTLAIVGESGSGKSTLALCLACLEPPTSGSIQFEEKDLAHLTENELRKIRPQIQLIFQDPANSLNPRWTAQQILLEPLLLQTNLSRTGIKQRATLLLEQVGLSGKILQQLPSQLSGGQRQRLAIARALSLDPKLLILDEALSSLDCSIQAQIANLLLDLQSSLGMAYLFITHDLAMAAHLADEIAVMHCGRIIDQGPAEKIFQHSANDSTRRLVAAVPKMPRASLPSLEK